MPSRKPWQSRESQTSQQTQEVNLRAASRAPRVMVVFTEGRKTEKHYVNYWARTNRDRVTVVVDEFHGVPRALVARAAELRRSNAHRSRRQGGDTHEYWCVFDRDEHPKVGEALNMAKDNRIKVAYSNPCIELWFVLHCESNERRSGPQTLTASRCQLAQKGSDTVVAVVSRRRLPSLALGAGVLVAVLLTACDFQVFRSEFSNVTYSIPTVTDEQVRLDESGRFEDEEARVRSGFVSGTAGDLNGDGILDGVAVLATNTGGSGTFYTVHAILGDGDGGYTDVGSVFLGDRIAVPGVTAAGATIDVSILDRAADEGFTVEPHIPDLVRLTFRDGELFRQSALQETPTE